MGGSMSGIRSCRVTAINPKAKHRRVRGGNVALG